jgi:predicted ester cyclase
MPRMTKKAFKAGIDRMVEPWNTGNVDALDKFMAADCVTHWPPGPDIVGREAYKKSVSDRRSILLDLRFTIHEYILDGNWGANPWSWTATHKDTGKQVKVTGVCITKWVNGKCVEHWVFADNLGLQQQLGFKLVPAQ